MKKIIILIVVAIVFIVNYNVNANAGITNEKTKLSEIILKTVSHFNTTENPEMINSTAPLAATAKPVMSITAGSYYNDLSVTLTCSTPNASIYYTTNGTTPDETDILYTGAITISSSMTLKAVAKATGYTLSNVASEAYALKAGLPSFSPGGGSFTGTKYVTITSVTNGASFRYTTDGGTNPTETVGTLYTGPIPVDQTMTLQVVAYKTGYTKSSINGYSFIITGASPVASPAAGTYNTSQTITLTADPSNANIRYTTNGTTPTSTSGTVYTGPFTISATTTVKAIAYKTGMTSSSVSSYIYTIIPKVETPEFTPVAGTYNTIQSVGISTVTSGASIRYTTDGSIPTASTGNLYTGSISINSNSTLKAIAYKTSYDNSDVASGDYILKCVNPTMNIVSGTYTTAQSITLSSTTSGSTIRYTTDGSTPSVTNGTVYTSAISIAASATLKAIAYKTGWTASDISSESYTINLTPVADPSFSPSAGTFSAAQSVAISSATVGATIRYTTDGSNPSETVGTIYTTAVNVSQNTTLKAIAYKSGQPNSSIISGVYNIKCASPSFGIAAGTYNVPQSISLTSTTSGATIRYTTDGSTPTQANGTVYTTAISVSTTTTLKAIAYKTGMTDSDPVSATYTIQLLTVADPSFSPSAGTYSAAQSVAISSATVGAIIRFTTDGSNPSETAGTIYTTAVNVSQNTTLKAIAYKTDMINSGIVSGVYNIKCASPSFGIAAGTYNIPQSITLTSSTSGATIRYTTDGSTPSQANGTVYTTAISVGTTTTLKAIAYKTGMTDSDPVSATYTIQLLTVADPSFSPSAGTFSAAQSVAISSATVGATIRYTTDGSNPSETAGTIYTTAVNVSQNTTLKAIAYKTDMINSGIVSGVYNIKCASPSFGIAAGTYNIPQSVTLTSATSGATIRYTTDGSTPSQANGTVYTTAISVGTTTTLKAIAYKTGMTDSDPVSATYTIQLLTVADPSFSPSAGTFSAAQSVAISSATVGATIRYTTDGSNPSETVGTVYSTAVSVSQNTTLKAIAYKTDMINSGIVSGVYNIKCASPSFGIAAGTYNVPQSISLTSATSGATIRYTTDGSTPSQANGTVYTTAISVGTTTTLKAIAYKTGMTDSDPVSADYIVFLDMDGDGVGDNDDEFQNDSVRAFNNYFPANGPGTLVFEDSWPSKGDYDMNDVVVDYQFRNIVNSNNKLVETYATFVLKASGAGLNSGFGFQFPNSNINASDINVSGYIHNAEPSYINVNNNGTEANQDKPTIVVFDNVFKVLQHPGVGTGINTTTGLPYVTPVTITIHITYTNNTYNEQQLDIAHFNPFIIINKVRGKEVHLPDYSPTSLANPSFFGTIEDNSNVGLNRYYKTKNNLPWALNLYESFSYPTERTPINEAYNHFIDWVISNGTLYTDWYKNNAGNINNSKIFTHQVKSSVSGSKNINNDNIKVITDKIK